MNSNSARSADPSQPRAASDRRRHLRLVSPDELAAVAARTADETGQSSDALLAFITGTLATSLPENARDVLFTDARRELDPAEVRQWLRIGELLQGQIRHFMDELKAAAPIEVPSSDVRKNWAEYVELVRTHEETVYITQHGRRVAALVPPFVAESYADEQAWFHTPQWQAKEAEADADIAAGRVRVYDSDESFLTAFEEGEGGGEDQSGEK